MAARSRGRCRADVGRSPFEHLHGSAARGARLWFDIHGEWYRKNPRLLPAAGERIGVIVSGANTTAVAFAPAAHGAAERSA